MSRATAASTGSPTSGCSTASSIPALMDEALSVAVLREEVVAITDDDCIPRPDWLARIERHFAADPRLGGLGGPDRLVQGGLPVVGARRRVGRVFWYGRFLGLHQLGIGPVRDV